MKKSELKQLIKEVIIENMNRHRYYDIPDNIDELFSNGDASYSITDPDSPGDNIYGMKLFLDILEVPDEYIKLDDGTQVFLSNGTVHLQIDSGGLGDFHLHGYEVKVLSNEEWSKLNL
jgi:hypothetical protein